MSTSNQTYKELSIPFFKETFDCIDQVMQAHKVPYYLIGVSAIALELLKDSIKPSRGMFEGTKNAGNFNQEE